MDEYIDFVGISAEEKAFIRDGIADNCRNDGRKNDDQRPLTISLNEVKSSLSSARVYNSESDVVVSIRGEIIVPSIQRPSAGEIFFDTEFAFPSQFESLLKLHFDDTASFGKRLSHALKKRCADEGIIPRESLCILKGRYVWALFVDIMVFGIGGNTLDVCSVAFALAMQSLRLPRIKLVLNSQISSVTGEEIENDPDEDIIDDVIKEQQEAMDKDSLNIVKLAEMIDFEIDRKNDQPLADAAKIPIIITVGLMDQKTVLDISQEERFALDYFITGEVSRDGRLRGITTSGSRPITVAVVGTAASIIHSAGVDLWQSILVNDEKIRATEQIDYPLLISST